MFWQCFKIYFNIVLECFGSVLAMFARTFADSKPCARAGALPPAGRNPQILHFLRIFKSDSSRVFEPWAECSLFWVKLKKTRAEIPYRIPVESYPNL